MGATINISEEHGVRYLHFGSSWVQGAMRIARPYALELEYTRNMMAGLLLRQGVRWPRNVLHIGLGAASLVKFFHRYYPHVRQVAVEISPQVVAAARQYFKLPGDPERLQIEIGDGVEYVAAATGNFDLILVDGFDSHARAGALDSVPFYQLCRGRLSDSGILAVNLLRRSRACVLGVERLKEAFQGRVFSLPATEGGNTIAFAAQGKTVSAPFPALFERALKLKQESRLDLLPLLEKMRRAAGDEAVLF
jgi:spermidine synthase